MAEIYKYNGESIQLDPDLTKRDYFCNFSLFEKIGVIGDSYANGYCGESSEASAGVNHPHIGWPKILERRNGVKVNNYSRGGQSTRSFIDPNDDRYSAWGMGKLLADVTDENIPQLFIFALGRNDFNIIRNATEGSDDENYLGSIEDITNYSLGTYPDTFYGNTATIIETIQQEASDSLMVMMTLDYSPNSQGYIISTAIKEIATYYSLPCMDQRSDTYFQGDNSYYREFPAGGHPAAIAYSGMELAIERLFNQCVKDNKSYFLYYIGQPIPVEEEPTGNSKTYYAVCDTAADTAVKAVTVDDSFELEEGAQITVVFSNANTAIQPTLNVNSLGNQYIGIYHNSGYQRLGAYTYNILNKVCGFIYDGTDWVLINYSYNVAGQQLTKLLGASATAEGNGNIASGDFSHAEGTYNKAIGRSSHAEGNNTIANYRSQHVFGEYNIEDSKSGRTAAQPGNYLEIVGNGTGSSARSNARTLDWSGNEVLTGKLTVGAAPTANMDVATKKYVDDSTISITYNSTTGTLEIL